MNDSLSAHWLDYCDYWSGSDKEGRRFASVLSQRYRLEMSDTPEMVLY